MCRAFHKSYRGRRENATSLAKFYEIKTQTARRLYVHLSSGANRSDLVPRRPLRLLFVCLLCCGAVMGAKRKRRGPMEVEGEPTAKRTTVQAKEAEGKEEKKDDAHKVAYAARAYRGNTPFATAVVLDRLLQQVRVMTCGMMTVSLCC